MNRHKAIQNLMQNMETLGRSRHGFPEDCPKNMPTQAQMGVLFTVWFSGVLTIKQLAERFNMSSSAATQLVNGLVKEGLITRTEDKTDRRKICLELTTKGKKAINELKQKRYQMVEKVLAPLSSRELDQLMTIAKKIVENLKILWTKKHHK